MTAGDRDAPDVLVLHPENDLVFDSRVKREAGSLAQAGYRVTVLARASARACTPLLAREGYRVEYVAWRGADIYLERFAARGAELGARVHHAHDVNALIAAHLTGSLGRTPLVYDSHEYWRAWDLPEWSAGAEAALIGRAAAVITVSEGIAARLREENALRCRIEVIRNCPPRPAVGSARSFGLRRHLGLSAHAPLAVFCGSVTAGDRGLETAIDALPLVPGWHLASIGDGPAVDALRERAVSRGVGLRTHFVPQLPHDQLMAALREADVGLCLNQNLNLSYYHSLPNKLFEYVLAGVGVIASDFPDMGAFVRRHGIGSLVAPDSAEALAGALREWPANRPEPAALLRAGDGANWESEQLRLLALYDALGGPRSGAWKSASALPAWSGVAAGTRLLCANPWPAEPGAPHPFSEVLVLRDAAAIRPQLASLPRGARVGIDEALLGQLHSRDAVALMTAARSLGLVAVDLVAHAARPFHFRERLTRRWHAHAWKRRRRRDFAALQSAAAPTP